MKKINEMTEQELLALTMDDVTMLAKQALMEENVKLVKEPSLPELQKVPKGDVLYYYICLQGNMVFTDMNEAIAVADAIRKCSTLHTRSRNWSMEGRYYSVTPISDDTNFCNVESDWGYSESAYSLIKDILESNTKKMEQYNNEMEEFKDFEFKLEAKKSEIMPIVYQTINKYNRLKSLCEDYLECYLPTAGNDPETAMKFMTLAYGLTEEEKKYIIENTTQEKYIIENTNKSC